MVILPFIPEFKCFMNTSRCSTWHGCSEPPWQITEWCKWWHT